jgi:imidazoleglycerol-phosphate dehydratase
MKRYGEVKRDTMETRISLKLTLDSPEPSKISTGLPFLDHMLYQIAKHGRINLDIQVKGDLEVDCHHTAEDVGMAFGMALREALGSKAGIRRFADRIVPMDEVLALCAVDLSGRAYLCYDAVYPSPMLGTLATESVREFFKGLADKSGMCLHFRILTPGNTHHMVEAQFKAFALALRDAVAIQDGDTSVPSTKGMLD